MNTDIDYVTHEFLCFVTRSFTGKYTETVLEKEEYNVTCITFTKHLLLKNSFNLFFLSISSILFLVNKNTLVIKIFGDKIPIVIKTTTTGACDDLILSLFRPL